jgi:uncharacterized protein (DUF433 family)
MVPVLTSPPRIYNVSSLDAPLYTRYEAAKFVGLPPATAYGWIDPGLITYANGRLPFKVLVHLYVVSVLRRHHKVSMKKVRAAVKYLQQKHGLMYPLAEVEVSTDGRNVMTDSVGIVDQIINASDYGQQEFHDLVAPFLKRVKRLDGKAVKLFPVVNNNLLNQSICIDPTIQFGRPCIAGTRILTSIIAERLKAGEGIAELAKDYDLAQKEIRQAEAYERAA